MYKKVQKVAIDEELDNKLNVSQFKARNTTQIVIMFSKKFTA